MNLNIRIKRLLGWQITAVLLLVAIALVSPQQLPVVIYKISLITLAAVLGYWLDRSLFLKPGWRSIWCMSLNGWSKASTRSKTVTSGYSPPR